MPNLKAVAARRQLGTALALHLRDQDPFSVHVLASGGAELAEGLAEEAGSKPVRDSTLASWPGVTEKVYYERKKYHVNAMKHFRDRNGRVRDDDEALSSFSEENNDVILWDGWSNLAFAGCASPIEAHVFVAWFLTLSPEKFPADDNAQGFLRLMQKEFPAVHQRPRARQKDILRRAIKRASRTPAFIRDEKVDRRPMILRG